MGDWLDTRIRIRGLNGDIEGKVWESDTVLRAGRLATLEIVLDDTSVSRRHAEVRFTVNGWFLRDLGSTNGTFVNGTRVGPEGWAVRAHDILRFGNVTFVVEMATGETRPFRDMTVDGRTTVDFRNLPQGDRKELTDITVVMDRSGSMGRYRFHAEGGLNAFIKQQKKLPGDALFTLVQFDNQYEVVHRGIPIQNVPHCQLWPRSQTALLDAVGRAIMETELRLSTIAATDRPGLVVIVIITDGQENSSTEYTRARVKEMIQHHTQVNKWQFTYLGAQDALEEAGAIGIDLGASASFNEQNIELACLSACDCLTRMRWAHASGETVVCTYSSNEREAMDTATD